MLLSLPVFSSLLLNKLHSFLFFLFSQALKVFHILLARSDLNIPVWEPGLQDSPSACPILNWQREPCGKSDTDSVSSALARFCLVSHLIQPQLTYTAWQGAGEVSTACCLLPGDEGLFPAQLPPEAMGSVVAPRGVPGSCNGAKKSCGFTGPSSECFWCWWSYWKALVCT